MVLAQGLQGRHIQRGVHRGVVGRVTVGRSPALRSDLNGPQFPQVKGGLLQMSGVHTGFPRAGCFRSVWGLLPGGGRASEAPA